jgi:hypothetical protein
VRAGRRGQAQYGCTGVTGSGTAAAPAHTLLQHYGIPWLQGCSIHRCWRSLCWGHACACDCSMAVSAADLPLGRSAVCLQQASLLC